MQYRISILIYTIKIRITLSGLTERESYWSDITHNLIGNFICKLYKKYLEASKTLCYYNYKAYFS